MVNNNIQSTVDNGRLHISYDGLYIDSIDSYNNWFTKFFAWAFGNSVTVTVHGKERALNKNDYANWINTHTDRVNVTKASVKEFADFCVLQVRAPNANATPISQHLSASKTQSLYYKLVRSMHTRHDVALAQKYVQKGAQLNQLFWTRAEFGISFGSMKAALPDKMIRKTEMHEYSPLLYAATNGWNALCELMKRTGANQQLRGQQVEFTRNLLNVDQQTSLNPTVSVVQRSYRRRGNLVITNHRQPHLNVQTKIIARFQDEETKINDLLYNGAFNTVVRQPVNQLRTVISNYNRIVENHQTRLI